MPSSSSRPGLPQWLAIAGAAVTAVVIALAVGFGSIYARAEIPSAEALRPEQPTAILDASGNKVATLEPGALGKNVKLSRLPDHVWQATLAAEDRRFFQHAGFSVPAILRAAWVDLSSWEIRQGASTISQQYVAMSVADVEASFPGKFREVAIASKLDGRLDKRTILQMYHNSVPYGRNAVGINAAAQTYFSTPPGKLSVNQAATLAGMIRAPSALDPAQNPEGARARRNEVLSAMAGEGWISQQRARKVRSSSLPKVTGRPPVGFGGPHAYFVDSVRTRVPELLGEDRNHPSTGLVIKTTLRPGWQKTALKTLRENVADTPYTGSVVSLDTRNGAVRALVGGLDFNEQRFNIATQARRGPGSSFKPYVLSTFVDSGGSPASQVRAPESVQVPGAGGQETIENYSGHGWGVVDVRKATVNSINTAYVNLGTEVGLKKVVDKAAAMGLDRTLPAVPANMIGAGGVTPLQHTSSYATLAAGGQRHEPFLVREIRVRDSGKVLYRHEPEPKRVLGRNAAAVVSDVLTDVVEEGTGTAADLERPVAGKTGTTDDFRDAWFMGYTPRVATSVWVGNRDFDPMDGVTGGSIPAETWSDYMGQILQGREHRSFPTPNLGPLEERYIGVDPGVDFEETEETEEDTEETQAPEPGRTQERTGTQRQTSSPRPEPTRRPRRTTRETRQPTGGDESPPPLLTPEPTTGDSDSTSTTEPTEETTSSG